MSTLIPQNIVEFVLQLSELGLFTSNQWKTLVSPQIDVWQPESADLAPKAKLTPGGYWYSPWGWLQAIFGVGGSGNHFRGWLFDWHLAT